MKPKIVVLGEKPQGATWLKYLINSSLFDIVAGVPRHGKKNIWWDGECFADILNSNGIPIVKRQDLHNISYDILWSLMYGFIIEGELIDKANIGLNLHEAPMPKYRGCNGYTYAILNGDKSYGTSFHVLSAELDEGSLIDQEIFEIHDNETVKELYTRTIGVSNLVFKRNINKASNMQFETKPLNTSDEPIKPRSSLKDKKYFSEKILDNVEYIYCKVRSLDFVPFEPPYFIDSGNKHYVFINNSLGRYDHCLFLNKYDIHDGINTHCKKETSFILEGMPRDLVVMKISDYEKYYPLFTPIYSWEKK